jgi:hypothetical protein
MQLLNQLETEPLPIEEEERRHTRRLMVGILCAVVLTGLVLGGYLFLRKRHERQLAAAAATEALQKKTPKVEVIVDDAMIEGKKTLLAGTIHNISGETLRNVAVELQLRKRSGGGSRDTPRRYQQNASAPPIIPNSRSFAIAVSAACEPWAANRRASISTRGHRQRGGGQAGQQHAPLFLRLRPVRVLHRPEAADHVG